MRCALYARFSTDMQNPRSIADQLVECARYAQRQGWTIDPADQFSDAAISGAAMANRPGVLALLAAARAGRFDVVLAEDLSRFSRDGGHPWDLYYDLEAAGVQLHTVWRGRVDEMVLGFEGAKNASERKAIGARVRRGQAGSIRQGRASGKVQYGYRLRREYDAEGEPIRGLREIDPDRAQVVRRIFAEFVGGSSPYEIARRLNAEAVPSPSGRGCWVGSGVSDLLKAPIYRGEIVWGLTATAKDRRTGKQRNRKGDPENVVRQAVPELAIVEPATWDAAQARIAERSAKVFAAGTPAAANAPKRLLSGLVKCGLCGATMQTVGPEHRYRCWRRTQGHACDNARAPVAERLEAQVLAELRRDLLHPDVIETVIREYREAQAAKGRAAGGRRHAAERELAEVRRKADALLELPAELIRGPSVAGKLKDLDARRLALEAELGRERTKAEVVALHPNTAGRYRQLVENLAERLAGPGAAREAARADLRQVVSAVVIHPEPGRGNYRAEVIGDAAGLLPLIADAAQAKRRTGT